MADKLGFVLDVRAFEEDLKHATTAGREVAEATARELGRDGLALQGDSRLAACREDGPDGTNLRGCVKLYLPDRGDRWRMVLLLVKTPNGDWAFQYLSFGLGHPTRFWVPSAYQVAHLRLHGLG